MKLSYKQKIFFYAFILLALFAGSIVLFEHSESKKFKNEALEDQLDVFATTLHKLIIKNERHDKEFIDSRLYLFPKNLRITVLDTNGQVFYDNITEDTTDMDNHLTRPEVIKAAKNKIGSDIRTSQTNNKAYIYYAKQYQSFYIRVALPYNVQTRELLKSDNIFLYFIILLSLISLYTIHLFSKRLSLSIRQLRDFTRNPDMSVGEIADKFPEDELGDVAFQIVENYKELEASKAQIALEKEKLLQHIHTSEEGICFFTSDWRVEFYNGLFMHYLNIMLDEHTSRANSILYDNLFREMQSFITNPADQLYYEQKINKQGRQFNLRVNIFEDKSFEIILNDISNEEKTRLIKQEMTNNIAHELRTPITSIRGYLETVKDQEIDEKQSKYFIDKAYNQVINLTQLIDDMSMITSIEEVPQSFLFEKLDLFEVVNTVTSDFATSLTENNININNQISINSFLQGNPNLLYAIFRNLIENTIKYGGDGANIHIGFYNEDEFYYYISYYDEGKSIIDEAHLKRLFERFYRVTTGRTRSTGGTGLGLSIVKNAIQIHKGTIIAKNRKGGGLEFLFKLKKNL